MTNSPPLAEIPPEQITKQLLREAFQDAWIHTTSLFGAEINGQPAYRGTATLVSAGGPCLLTAAHVWEELRQFTLIGLSLGDGREPVAIRREFVVERFVSQRGTPEWGPDLALIGIPELKASELRAHKAFYNLDRRRPAALETAPYTGGGMWGVLGAAAEQASFAADVAILPTNLFVSVITATTEQSVYDYLDLAIRVGGSPGLPTSYGGLSGAGLWRYELTKSESTGRVAVAGRPSLEGVAFYQGPGSDRSFIRCHGRRSVYQRVLENAA